MVYGNMKKGKKHTKSNVASKLTGKKYKKKTKKLKGLY